MDQIQGYLATNLPPSLLSHVTTHSATYYKIYQQFVSLQREVTTKIINPLLSTTTSYPDVTSLVLLLATLLISLAFLRMLYRTIVWWIKMAFRIVVLGSMLLLGLWVLNRGVDGAWGDLQGLGETWKREYERYDQMGRVKGGRGGNVKSGWL